MYGFLLAVLILDGVILSAVVLLQAGQGGGLAAMGGGMGTDNLIGGRQAATLLTRMSWITGGVFLALSLLLSIVSSRNNAPRSILRDQFTPPAATAPATNAPGTNAPATLPGTQPAADPGATAPAGDASTPAPATTNNQ